MPPPIPAPVGDEKADVTPQQASNGELIRRMLGLGWQYRGQALLVLVLQLLLLALALSGLGLTGLGVDVIRYAIRGVNEEVLPPEFPFDLHPPADWTPLFTVFIIGCGILGIASVRVLLDMSNTIAVARLIQDIVARLRSDVYAKLQRLDFRFYDANESGSIINRVTGDVQSVRSFVDQVALQVLLMAISLVFFLVYMLSIHAWLTLWCLVTTPLLWVITVWFSRTVRPAYRRNRELYDNTIRVLSENVQGHHVVKGFGLQEDEVAKFAVANDEVTSQQQWIFWRVSVFGPLISFIPQINILILLVYGGWLVIQNELRLGGGLIVFAGLLQQFSGQIGNIAQIANTVQRALIGAQRVFEVLDQPETLGSPDKPEHLPGGRAKGQVTFENVSFRYDDTADPPGPLDLKDISFSIRPGQSVAIVGATGSGKSTMLSLIPRFYDPQHGRVTLDGIDIRQLELDELRRNIGLVFQESFLFSTTVRDNIAFGHPEATREQVERAAQIAQAEDFIKNDLSNGYDTVLTEAGGNLSGGQRQRLAIARAVLLEPPILLLDDPTAAIDPETEHEILEAMDRAMQGRTNFVIAHRLSTLRRADLILVMEKGRIVERGTHDELMDHGGHYRHAASIQMADDEDRRLLNMELTPHTPRRADREADRGVSV